MRRGVIIVSVMALFIIQAVIRFRSDINHDAAWYLYVADGLLHGKQLYTDFLEVNPPLGMWLTVPIVWLGSLTGLGSINANFGVLLALTVLTLLLVNRYLRLMRDVPDTARALLCVFIAAAILFMPALDFTEREHLMVLLFLPWPFLRLARLRGIRLGAVESVLVGAMAAAAIAIKPQSFLAPLGVELVLLLRYRNFHAVFAVENIAALVFVAFYGAVIAVFAPDFLGFMVDLGVKAYVPFMSYPNATIWLFSIRSILLVVFALLLWQRSDGPMADVTALLAAAAAGFILSYFIQYKGFSYQILPARIFAAMACAAAVSGIVARTPFVNWPSATKRLVGASAFVVAVDFGFQPQTYPNNDKFFDVAIARYAPDSRSIYIASTRVSHGFPFALNRDLVWASRLSAQWLAPYVASKWQGGTLPQDDIVARALDWTVSDLVTFRPDIVFIDESKEQFYVLGGHFDYEKFWSNDPRFATLWAGYERRASMNGFAVYTER
ncbi:MAG TPA: hypothetical protein VJ019_09375 [Aestuariivirga sp.]|jgi:hypothetical protein|nr:hypothetical protein [Aestuariivirga sp.]